MNAARDYSGIAFIAGVLLSGTSAWANSPPAVSNVTSSQRTDGSKIVDIRYNLSDADGDACTVTVQASNDGGATWTVPITALSGAVGAGINPGVGKLITWVAATDLPGAFGTQYKVRVCADDGYDPVPPGMVLVPAGEFWMGDSFSEGNDDELPQHAVHVDGFYMDTYEVTNQQYAYALNWAYGQGGLITVTSGVVYKYNSGTSYPYCDTTTSSSYSRITWNGSTFEAVSGKEDHPMARVSWYGSVAYANWRSAMQSKPLCYVRINENPPNWDCNFGSGYRLPTEAEWEKASRGGTPGHRFPWSDQETIQHARANYRSSSDYAYDTSPTRNYHPLWGVGAYPWTSPVGFFTGALRYKADWGWPGSATSYQTTDGTNGYGLCDMAGNVWEWCYDRYSSSYYQDYLNSGSPPNPDGPTSGTGRVLRGGGWSDIPSGCRAADRSWYPPTTSHPTIGFRLALDAGGALRDSDCDNSAAFTVDNRGDQVTVYQWAVGVFLADVPFNNIFKAVINWGGSTPGTVTFAVSGQSVTVPYGADGAQTSALNMGSLPGGECAVTSILTITARNSGGQQIAQTAVPLRCINRPWFMPANVRAKSLSPLGWAYDIVYELNPQLTFMNLDATWYGENALFKNYGGLISGGKLNIEFNGAKGEYTFEVGADLNPSENKPKLGKLLKPTTRKQKMGWDEGESTLAAGFSVTATISPATGCFDGGPEVCAGGEFGYEWKLVPVGPLFGIPILWLTGKAGFDIGPEFCFDPLEFSLDNPVPLTAVDVEFNLLGQGGLELGVPYFLSVFGGLEGNAGGKIHVLGDPVPTCWDWPLLADLDFDLSIVGYARLGFGEWELGRYVIVQWSCPQGRRLGLVRLTDKPAAMRLAQRPYLENGEPYAQFEPGVRQGADVRRDASRGETDELITANSNLEATPAMAGWGNLTLVATSEDDPNTPEYAEHEIHAVFRDGAVWGEKQQITSNTDPDIQPALGFDASGKAIVVWTTIAAVSGSEDLAAMKSKMEIAYSAYDGPAEEWSVPVQITSNGSLDAMPQFVRGGDGSTNLVWLYSGDNSLPIGPGEPLGTPPSVLAARWNGTAFGPPEVLLPACEAVGAIRYSRDASGREFLLWTWDGDADLGTIEDREVVESHTVGGVWTDPVPLTSNGVPDTAVGLLPTAAGAVAYFTKPGGTEDQPEDLLAGRVFDGSEWSDEEALISAPTTILSPSLALAADGGVSCAWIGPAINSNGKAVLYATSSNGITDWSEPQEMAVSSLPTAPACTYAGTNLQVSYVSARLAKGAKGVGFSLRDAKSTAFDVRLLDHAPYTDLWIGPGDLAINPQPPLAGDAATIGLAVRLSGDSAQTGVEIEVFDGDPSAGGVLIGSAVADLTPGGKTTLEFPWTYPSEFDEHEIYAVVDSNGVIAELSEDNNLAHVAIGSLNLQAVSVHPVFWTADNIGLELAIRDTGYATLEDVAYELRRDAETGPLIQSGTVPSVPAGEQVDMVVPWDITLTDPGVYELFLIVDPFGAVQEEEESDNSISGKIRVLPDLQTEQWSAVCTNGVAEVVVRNVGAKPMGANVARAIQGAQTFGEAAVSAMNPGESVDISITLTQAVPAGWLTITVNPSSDGSDEVTLLNNTAMAAVNATGDWDGDGDVDLGDYTAFAECVSGPRVLHAGDSDTDGDVDLADFATWDVCLDGPGIVTGAGCGGADVDGDLDVDLADFAAFQHRFTDSVAPSAECLHTFDFDADHDIDLFDFTAFQAAYTG